jgi:hypothetical protein
LTIIAAIQPIAAANLGKLDHGPARRRQPFAHHYAQLLWTLDPHLTTPGEQVLGDLAQADRKSVV